MEEKNDVSKNWNGYNRHHSCLQVDKTFSEITIKIPNPFCKGKETTVKRSSWGTASDMETWQNCAAQRESLEKIPYLEVPKKTTEQDGRIIPFPYSWGTHSLGFFFFLQGKLYCDTVKHEKSLPPAHSCFSMCWTKNLYLFRVTDLNKNSTLGTCASSSQVPELKPLYWKSVKQDEVLKCQNWTWHWLSMVPAEYHLQNKVLILQRGSSLK